MLNPPLKKSAPTPWSQATRTELGQIVGICFDIDDTFSSRGKITAEAFSALWRLREAGYGLVPVTGRPAGWCDHIARFWPVDAVVGENGAFSFQMEGGVRRRLDTPGADPAGPARLAALAESIRARFPHAIWASDQKYREFDLAIDICEDVPAWPAADVQSLIALCHRAGAHAKLSSVHVNTWFGEFDKRRGLKNWFDQGCPGLASDRRDAARQAQLRNWDHWIYVGDSPNDEPLFEVFKHSVGVANLASYLDRLTHPPKWITAAESGTGFSELANTLLAILNK